MRAEEEEAKAAQSQDEAAKTAHLNLASIYRRSALDRCPRSMHLDQIVQALGSDPLEPPHPRQP
jgi:hypothetical protein